MVKRVGIMHKVQEIMIFATLQMYLFLLPYKVIYDYEFDSSGKK